MKRKRSEYETEDDKTSKLRAKLHHGIKEIQKAAKKVKAFETQKIVKRLKNARQTDDNELVQTLERQLDIMKHIDIGPMAAEALRSKIRKDPELSHHAECEAVLQTALAQVNEELDSTSKEFIAVRSRLLSSKVLAKDIADIIIRLRNATGMERNTSKEDDINSHSGSEENREANNDDSWEGFQSEGSGEGSHTDAQDEPTIDNVDGEDPTGWESGSVVSSNSNDDDTPPIKSIASPEKRSRKALLESSKAAEMKAGKGESAFLPSLSVGFIDAHSDSDWSDAEANVADAPIKKNRRGQRARKAIWEKKYGKNANHLKKQREAEAAAAPSTMRDSGWKGGRSGDAAVSAARGRGVYRSTVRGRGVYVAARGRGSGGRDETDPSTRQRDGGWELALRTRQGREQGALTGPSPQGGRGAKTNVSAEGRSYGTGRSRTAELQVQNSRVHNKHVEKPLHPSWEAKRKLKAKENGVVMPSQGTKLKFT